MLLDYMQPNIWYKASELLEVVSVKESRLKILLAELVKQGELVSKGNTKGKMYMKSYHMFEK